MKNRIKHLLCFALAVILFLLPSCSMFWSSNHSYSGGQMLDDELMSSMRAEVLGDKTESSSQDEIDDATVVETKPNQSENEAESDETEKEAETSKDYDDTQSSKPEEQDSTQPDDDEADGTVYWTKKGGVYHLYRDCSYIKSSSEVISGTAEEALEAGKSDVCSRCQGRKDKE